MQFATLCLGEQRVKGSSYLQHLSNCLEETGVDKVDKFDINQNKAINIILNSDRISGKQCQKKMRILPPSRS